MPESHQDKGPDEGSPSPDRQDMIEKPAGFRAAHPPTETDVDAMEEDAGDTPREASDQGVSREAGDNADAVVDAPQAAKPGAKEEPDMKDMGLGARPTDDQSAG